MAMQWTTVNDVKTYNLSGGKTLTQFLEDSTKESKSLKKDENYKSRLELMQDFEFRETSSRVCISKDRQYIGAVGSYPPEMKVFDTEQLGLKFMHRTDHESIDIVFLDTDFRKLVMLQTDRYMEFHSQFGKHHKFRVPKPGRELAYDKSQAHLYVAADGSQVFRFDLDEGIFLEPLTTRNQSNETVCFNPCYPFVICGGDTGVVEAFDCRMDNKKPCSVFDAFQDGDDEDNGRGVNCSVFSGDGMKMGLGMASGLARVFDIRSQKPLAERDHNVGLPMKAIDFTTHQQSRGELLVGSADERTIKIWNAATGELFTSIDSQSKLNDVKFFPESGLILTANDSPRCGAFYVPSLGVAPRWCHFLDNLTEELEADTHETVFTDQHFVTREHLEQLGAGSLIGTNMLKPHLHGFLIHIKLYKQLKSVTEPFAYEQYRQQKVQERLKEKRQMRIPVKQQVNVNQALLERLEEQAKSAKKAISRKQVKQSETAGTLLQDSRFISKLFANPDYQIEKVEHPGEVVLPESTQAVLDKALAKQKKKRVKSQK